jgi:hypothetical protein
MSKNPRSSLCDERGAILCRQNSLQFSRQVSPTSLLGVSAGNCRTALVEELGMDRTLMGAYTNHKWSLYVELLVRCYPVGLTVTVTLKLTSDGAPNILVALFVKAWIHGLGGQD